MKRVAIYTRVSADREENEDATERQEESCRQFAASKGWDVVEVYSDPGVSAFDERAHRPGFERLRHDARAGLFDVVLVWRNDRLFRRLVPFMRFIDEELLANGVRYVAVVDGFDLTTPTGRVIAQVMGAFAEYESASTALRIRDKNRKIAASGGTHSGGKRAFGYHRYCCLDGDGDVICEAGAVHAEEAARLREAARRFLDGDSLRSIAIDWNDRGLLTTAGNPWGSNALGQALRNPRLAGYRVHRTYGLGPSSMEPGKQVRKVLSEQIYKGDWEPIFDEDLHAQLLDALTDAKRRAPRRTKARHLLTNILRCGLCGAPMQSRGADYRNGKMRYACVKRPEATNCGSVTIDLGQLEQQVFEDVVAALDAQALQTASVSEDVESLRQEVEEALRADQGALEELSQDFYVHRVITREEFLAARVPLSDRIRDHETMITRLRQSAPVPDLPDSPEALVEWWEDEVTTLHEKRALLDTILEKIEIGPVRSRGYNKWDPDRITYVWRV